MIPGKKYAPEDILMLLWRYRWYLVVPLFVSVFGALLLSRYLPNRYQSDALIQVVPQRVPESYVQSTVTLGIEDRIKSITQQIMSRTQLETIVTDFNLYPDLRKRLPMEDVVGRLRSDIAVDTVGAEKSPEAFRIKFTYDNPQTATKVTERLASLYIEENLRDRGALAEATSDFLGTQLADARSRLEAHEKKLKEFRERYSGRLPTQMESNLQALQRMQMQVQSLVDASARERDRKTILQRLYADAEADAANPAVSPYRDPAPGAGGDAAAGTGSTAQRLEGARATLAQLELRLKPEHPDIIRTKRIIRDLETKFEAELAAGPSAADKPGPRIVSPEETARRNRMKDMRVEMDSLDRSIRMRESEEASLRGQIADYQRRVEAVPGLESEWIALTRDYDTLQGRYRELLGKSEQSKVSANLERRQIGEQFRLLDPPRVPSSPISPDRVRINLMGVGLGLLLGLGFAAFKEYRDTSLKTEADVHSVLALPVLAVVPYVATKMEKRAEQRKRMLVGVAASACLVTAAGVAYYLRLWHYVM